MTLIFLWLEKFHMPRIVLRLIHFIILKKRDGVTIFPPSIFFMVAFFQKITREIHKGESFQNA